MGESSSFLAVTGVRFTAVSGVADALAADALVDMAPLPDCF